MIYGNLFSKLLKEDLKRRTWAVALTFLVFFFSLPIGLALALEGAENTNYVSFNNERPFINDGTIPEAQFREKLLSLRTEVVLSQAGFGNGLAPFLLIVAALVIGVSSFSYLHNKQKVDFYHSIPVKREALFGCQFMGGILMTGVAYGINLLLLTVVALAYGVPLGAIAGSLAGGWAFNMLYFMLMYATVVIAMMMTGNMVVGILAAGVFFFFLPGIMFLLSAYCQMFFVTTARYMWTNEHSPFWWGVKYLSPFSIYMEALSWKLKDLGKHVPELFCSVAAVPALTLLSLWLYRIRPSEAAGRAMAFRRSKAPIRLIMVIGFGLSGGMFFWILQNRVQWAIFGAVVSVLLSHCIIEIIYHFDFKKLFANKLQLGLSLVVTILLFLSFRFDWYGYDSYLPRKESVVSASLDVEQDHQRRGRPELTENEDGALTMKYTPMYDYIENNMKLTDLDSVLAIVEESRDRTLEGRDRRLEGRNVQQSYAAAASYTTIGGADGPTAVFLAGKQEGEQETEDKFFTTITVCYELKDGRKVSREYQNIPISSVMDAYRAIYGSQEYKEGLYDILGQAPSEVCQVVYSEAGQMMSAGEDREILKRILEAYQSDLMKLSVEERMAELPLGRISFVTDAAAKYMRQKNAEDLGARLRWNYSYQSWEELNFSQNYDYFWPVYPSFTRTIALLEQQDILPGTYFVPDKVDSVVLNVLPVLQRDDSGSYSGLPKGEELEALKKLNPNYRGDGFLEFRDQKDIKTLMDAMAQEDCYSLNYLYDPPEHSLKGITGSLVLSGGRTVTCVFTGEHVTPELLKLFEGIPIEKAGDLTR